MKLLLLLLVAVAVAMWLQRARPAARSAKTRAAAGSGQRQDVVEAMVQCAHCGLHLPASESVGGNTGTFFCSEEHRQHYAGI